MKTLGGELFGYISYATGAKQIISSALFVSRMSVDRFLQLYISTGTVQHKLQCHGPQPVLNEFEQLYLLESLIHNPTMYFQELQSELIELTGSQVHQ